MARESLTTLLWSAGGALLGLCLGLLCSLLFEGIGLGFGIAVGIVFACALGFAGYLFARDQVKR